MRYFFQSSRPPQITKKHKRTFANMKVLSDKKELVKRFPKVLLKTFVGYKETQLSHPFPGKKT